MRSGEESRGIAGRASEIHRQSVSSMERAALDSDPANEPRNPRPFAAGNGSRRLLIRNRKCSVRAVSAHVKVPRLTLQRHFDIVLPRDRSRDLVRNDGRLRADEMEIMPH
jgi:hypothetical protein